MCFSTTALLFPLKLHVLLQEELTSFLNASILTAGAGLDSSPALASCRLQPEKNFAFIELRSAEEATNVMALDGVCLRGEIAVKVGQTLGVNVGDMSCFGAG